MPLLRHNVQHNLTTVRAMQENTTRGRQTESPGKQMKVQSDASFPVTRVLEWGTASLPSDVETQRKVVETEDEDGAVSPSLPTPCFEIVVGADVMYKLELEDPLLVSIDQCCAWNGRTVLYLARLQRGNPTQYRRFYETLARPSKQTLHFNPHYRFLNRAQTQSMREAVGRVPGSRTRRQPAATARLARIVCKKVPRQSSVGTPQNPKTSQQNNT